MLTPEERRAHIERFRRFPDELEALVSGLSEAELRTHFIEGEWTVAQNVHHLADSHMNAFNRLKLMLTEDHPTVRPYDQDAFALLADYDLPLESSLTLLRGLHAHWCALFESLTEAQWARTGLNPESGETSCERNLIGYSKHCDAHLEQITRTLAAGRSG